jgi:hypothetical protein
VLQDEIDAGLAAVAGLTLASKDRLIYRVWDLLKDPTKILQAIGDVFVARGRKEAAIGRVHGLKAFWNAALDAPPNDVTESNLRRLLPRMAEGRVWSTAQAFQRSFSEAVSRGVWSVGPSGL